MSLVPLDLFLPWVRLTVRTIDASVPDDLLLDAIARAAQDFTREAKVLTRDVVLDQQDCVQDYALPDCPDGAETLLWWEVSQMSHCAMPVAVRNGDDTGMHAPAGWLCGRDPTAVWTVETNTVHLDTKPVGDVANAIKLRMVVSTNGEQCPVPELLYSRHRDAIEAGAAARILTSIAPKVGLIHRKVFEAAVVTAVARRIQGHAGRPARLTACGFIAR